MGPLRNPGLWSARCSRREGECLMDKGEKRLVVERLAEKGKRAAFQSGGTNRGYFAGGHHDHFRFGRYHPQLRLHFQAARFRHPDIKYGQRYRMAARVREKVLRIFEALRLEPIRIKQLLNRVPDRRIVIDDAYRLGLCAHHQNEIVLVTIHTPTSKIFSTGYESN